MVVTEHKSVSVSDHARKSREKKDERVVRTRRQIDAAFVELLHRRDYGNIRVSDITRKAGVGRATFYSHYASKDELLLSQFNRIVAPMLALTPAEACPLDATAFFAHVFSASRIYKALTNGAEAGGAPRILRDCFEARVRQALEWRGECDGAAPKSGLQQAVIARAVASSLLAVIECGMESSASPTPQEAQAILSKLVGGGLTALRRASSY